MKCFFQYYPLYQWLTGWAGWDRGAQREQRQTNWWASKSRPFKFYPTTPNYHLQGIIGVIRWKWPGLGVRNGWKMNELLNIWNSAQLNCIRCPVRHITSMFFMNFLQKTMFFGQNISFWKMTPSYPMLIMYLSVSHLPHVTPGTGHWERKCQLSCPCDPDHMSAPASHWSAARQLGLSLAEADRRAKRVTRVNVMCRERKLRGLVMSEGAGVTGDSVNMYRKYNNEKTKTHKQ